MAFGDRDDTGLWSDRASGLTRAAARPPLRHAHPAPSDIQGFMATSPEWIFMGGHFRHGILFNGHDGEKRIGLRFAEKYAVLIHQGKETPLIKGEGFQLHRNAKVVFWGGCGVHASPDTVNALRDLFGSEDRTPLMIGWSGFTGWQVTHSIMGGYGNTFPHASEDFFDRLDREQLNDPRHIAEAWLGTVRDTDWGKDSKVPGSASVILPDGTELGIVQGRVAETGRHFGKQKASEPASESQIERVSEP